MSTASVSDQTSPGGQPLTSAPDSGSQDGTQAIRRAVSILRLIATHRSTGASLANVCEAIQLPRSTTHRILKCLVSEGLLETLEGDGKYVVGPLASELSLSSLQDHHAAAAWSTLLARIARRTGHTTYLMSRTGREAVCLQRADGHALLRISPIEVGQRRPLGVGAGATALLSEFYPDEIRKFVESIGPALRPFKGLAPEEVLEEALKAKEVGYALSFGRVFSQTAGIGIALPGDRPARLAVSITCPPAYVDETGAGAIIQMMREEIENTNR